MLITSVSVSAEAMLKSIRSHWGIESMHWVLDVVFNEDASSIRQGNAPANMVIIRSFVLNILNSLNNNQLQLVVIETPSLPNLAKDLAISANLSEYTLTIYLFGFAVGVLIWGNLSDYYGRKPCLLAGFLVYALSCCICYLADNINMLLVASFWC